MFGTVNVPFFERQVVSIGSAFTIPTQLITSVVTETASGTNSLAPVTVVLTSVIRPSTTAALRSASSSAPLFTSTLTSTLSLLPLTTIFTPPAPCHLRPFTLTASSNTSLGVWRYQNDSADPCYPPLWATAKTNYYRPGACPSGHAYVRLALGGPISSQYTSVNCCPSGMDLVDTKCHTTITTPTYALMPDLETFSITKFPFIGVATALNVVWVSEDLDLFTPKSAPATGVANMLVVKTASSSPKELSSGSKAGIGVGVALGCLVLVGVMVFFVLRVRKRRARRAASTAPDDVDSKPELSGDSTVSSKAVHELNGQKEAGEMEADAMFPELAHLIKSSELEVPHQVHELP
ncbi:hypothetical protein D6C90_07374 [Aureobasidium pullulans]|uniref:Uncharacterized protein n=1 Tax=Aureobasidium pullulans TaxID=5580 RepID=A0A4S9UAW1_AURPU|nr:hypothetical protein D6C90_07374 [Aureobasidium pullulans]